MTFLINLLCICIIIWVVGFLLNGRHYDVVCKTTSWEFCFNPFYLSMYFPGVSEIFIASGLIFQNLLLLVIGFVIGIVAAIYILYFIWVFWPFVFGD
jgi:hypothetical protein